MEREATGTPRPRGPRSGAWTGAAGIFISYRRSDSAAIAGRIHDRLDAHYGASSVFLDVDDIPPGTDFREHIRQTLKECRVVLALVGPRWLGVDGAAPRRIDSDDDPVRAEIEMALREKVALIPLLVDGAQMPEPADLPHSLRDFAYLNAARVENSREFHTQIDRLIQFVDGTAVRGTTAVRKQRGRASPPPTTAAPKLRGDFDDRPAVAVLPFENYSDAAGQEHFADGLTDDIINELASWRVFPVIARTSTFAFKGQRADAEGIGAKLGARYIVHGSYSRAGHRLRVAARLVDANTGHQLASDRFDRDIDEVFEVKDQIAQMIAGSIAPEVLKAERNRISRRPSRNPGSYEYLLRGMEVHYRYTQADNSEAQRWFRKAIEADPRNAQAHALLASAMIHAVQLGWRNDAGHNYQVADTLAARAVALDPRAPFAHFSLASTSMFLGRIDIAFAEMTEAVRINPSHAAAHALMAHLLCFFGRPTEALASVQKALRLSPYDARLGLWLAAVAQARYFLGQYEEAAAAGQQALALIPENLLALRFTVASLGKLGRSGECGPLLAVLGRSTAPSIDAIGRSIQHLYRAPEMVEQLLDGLRKAGFG